MRLNFNVLWVDDQPDRISAQIKSIERQMEEEGFRFNATVCQTIEDVEGRISDDVFTDEIDLVLVDWDLGGSVSGEDAIAKIRETIRYKDIVFYSAQHPAVDLRRLASEKGVEGIYCATRQDIVDEVTGVFESLVKKVLDLDHTRGIVMGATSDIDEVIRECLLAAHGRLDEAAQGEMLKQAVELIEKRVAELQVSAQKLKAAKNVHELFEAHMLFTAYDRLRILVRVLKGDTFSGLPYKQASLTAYMQDVMPKRNKLGHIVLVPEGKPEGVFAGETVVTLEEMRELRRLILGLRDDFNALRNALTPTGAT